LSALSTITASSGAETGSAHLPWDLGRPWRVGAPSAPGAWRGRPARPLKAACLGRRLSCPTAA